MADRHEVDLSDREALADAVDGLEAGGVKVSSSEAAPPLFASIDARIALPSGQSHEIKGRVVNLAASGDGFFVQFEAGPELDALVEAARSSLEAPPAAEDTTPNEPAIRKGNYKPAWELIDSRSDVPMHEQLRRLTLPDKIRLARTAPLPARRILVRDIEKRIHFEVVKNPKIGDEEIVEYSRIAGFSPRALVWISKQPKYVRNRRVLMNLIENPATPQDVSLKLIRMLNQNELLRVMRSPRVREAVQRAARKKLMQAGVL